ncbi:hypothetical protein E2542_SST27717 [Spatholobus suberectus]|nr:hypothetical protein E2542_SST27717 [Spatholobus suberectus]
MGMNGNSNKAHQEHAGGVEKTRGIVAGVLRDYKRAGEAEPSSIETGIAVVRPRVARRWFAEVRWIILESRCRYDTDDVMCGVCME